MHPQNSFVQLQISSVCKKQDSVSFMLSSLRIPSVFVESHVLLYCLVSLRHSVRHRESASDVINAPIAFIFIGHVRFKNLSFMNEHNPPFFQIHTFHIFRFSTVNALDASWVINFESSLFSATKITPFQRR